MLINPVTVSLLIIISIVQGELKSPCPSVFKYQPIRDADYNRWYGDITLHADEKSEELWLKITLDKPTIALGNYIAEAILEDDNVTYSIRKPSYPLVPGIAAKVSIFAVHFDPNPPMVKKILLNGEEICPMTRLGSFHIYTSKPRLPPREISTPSPYVIDVRSKGPEKSHSTRTRTNEESSSTVDHHDITVAEKNRTEDSSAAVSPSTNDDQFYSGDFHVVSSEKSTSRPLTVVRQSVQCGTVVQKSTPLINHGQETTPGQWPWHVALYRLKGIELIYTCGGTLISQQFIVTAAHCVTIPRTNSRVDKDYLIVYLGKYSLIEFSNDVQTRDVERIIVHPEYNYSLLYNDIALLKLNYEAELNNFVRPCCLWDDESDNMDEGLQGTVVGWGYDENKQLSKTLMQAQMPIVSTKTCLLSNRNLFSQFIHEKNFCAGFKNGTSVCNGDSGGGLVIQKFSPKGMNTLWQLKGIVSLGVALEGGVCNPNQYIIFTDAGQYVNWIKEIIDKT